MIDPTVLGATLLHSLWQGTLLAALLWLVSRHRGIAADIRYRFAYGALLLQAVLSVATFFYYHQPGTHLESELKRVVVDYLVIPGPAATHPSTSPAFWMWALTVVWALSIVVGSTRLTLSFWRGRRMQSQSNTVVSEELRLCVRKLASLIGYRGDLRIGLSAVAVAPQLIGHLRPFLLLPVAIVNQLSTEETEAVLLHELAHLRRYDHWFNLLQCLIEVLFYYHPAIHWIGARIREEREYCCDDLVLEYGPGRLPYARALLHYGERTTTTPATVLSLTDGGGLLARVSRFLHNQPIIYTMKCKLLLLPLLASVVLISTASYVPFIKVGEADSSLPTDTAPALPAQMDTLPPGTHQVTRISDGKVTKLKVEDRQITRLEIDGREVPPAEFPQNEPLAEELLGVRPQPLRWDSGDSTDWRFDNLEDDHLELEKLGSFFQSDSLYRVADWLGSRVGVDSFFTEELRPASNRLEELTETFRIRSLSSDSLVNLRFERLLKDTMLSVRFEELLADSSIQAGFSAIRDALASAEDQRRLAKKRQPSRSLHKKLESRRNYLRGKRNGTLDALRDFGISEEMLRPLLAPKFSNAALDRINDLDKLDRLEDEMRQLVTSIWSSAALE